MTRSLCIALCLFALAFNTDAQAAPDDLVTAAQAKLGEAFAAATPADKLVLISVAAKDKVLNTKETSAMVGSVTTAEVDRATGPKERLQILGKLRAEATSKLKAANKVRKGEKKPFASLREPESYFQQALAFAYISSAGGPKPTLEKLECLKLVRDSTVFSSHHQLLIAIAQDAFARDEAFGKADAKGKLTIIREQSVTRGLLSDQERTYLEKGVLTEWMGTALRAGESPAELSDKVSALLAEKLICYYTSSWATGILKRMALFPNAKQGE
jgi:hypothetical protein